MCRSSSVISVNTSVHCVLCSNVCTCSAHLSVYFQQTQEVGNHYPPPCTGKEWVSIILGSREMTWLPEWCLCPPRRCSCWTPSAPRRLQTTLITLSPASSSSSCPWMRSRMATPRRGEWCLQGSFTPSSSSFSSALTRNIKNVCAVV